jgi:sucrose-6-phosphate hydrolase SacC (GH32 family)
MLVLALCSCCGLWHAIFQVVQMACAGPHRLDLGDILYAPNAFTDAHGRTLMVAWLQDLRQGGSFDYAGCLSVPRVLILQGQ